MGFTVTISGTYYNPQTQPLPGVTLIFETIYNSTQTQLQTTVSIITESDGSYSISLVPNTYAVCEFASGRKKWLGNIQVFSDSVPGTLNEYLTNFQPDQSSIGDAGEAAASAAAAKASEDASATSASAAAASAAAAKSSEDASTGSASAAAASAAAAKASEEASAGNAGEAAGSAAAAEKAAERAEAASTDPEVARVSVENVFTKRQNFNEGIDVKTAGSSSSFDRVKVTATFSSTGGSEFEGDVIFAHRTGKGVVNLYCPLTMYSNQRIKLYSSGGSSFSGIEFYLSGMTAVQGGIYPNTSKSRLELWHKTLPELEINLPNADPDGLKFIGKDGVEQTMYHSGNLPSFSAPIPIPGEPGSTILCSMNISGGSKGAQAYGIGTQKSGSLLRPCGLVPDVTGETKFLTMPTQSSTTLAGTWAACSLALYGTGPSLWVRIDTPDLINSGTNLLRAGAGGRIRNCRYANPEGTAIDCEVNTVRGWLPFTASRDDSTEWGPKIYAAAIAGNYGDVLGYVE